MNMALCEHSHGDVLETISIEDSDDDVLFVETDTESVVPSTYDGDGASELEDDNDDVVILTSDDDEDVNDNDGDLILDETFVCGGCFTAFPKSAALAEHALNECPLREERSKESEPKVAFRELTRRGVQAFGCEQCSFFGRTKQRLFNHVKTQHTLDKNHKCPKCSKSFTWKTHLLKHIYKVHFEYIASMPMQLVEDVMGIKNNLEFAKVQQIAKLYERKKYVS